jgi:transketolase
MMRDAFVRRLTDLAIEDHRVMIVTGDLGFGVLTDFAVRFPSQYLNAGVAEQSMTGLATGLAVEGRTVFTYSIANFPTLRCLEQVRNDAAYHKANVKIVAVGGGFSYGYLGMSHHATEDLAILRSLPLTLVAPGCDWEASEATSALAKTEGTCYLRLDKSGAGDTQQQGESFVLGKARVLRDGTDVCLISTGGLLGEVLAAADDLATRGIHARVVSMHTLKPLDTAAIISAASETGGIVTVEEHTRIGGLGSAVAETCFDSGVTPPFLARMGALEELSSTVGSQTYLRARNELDRHGIVKTTLTRLKTHATTG